MMTIIFLLKYIYFVVILKPITILLYYIIGNFFSPYIPIDDKLYFTCGCRRKVYIHPNDNDKIIKISKEEKPGNKKKGYIWNNNMENYRSYLFMPYLKFIPKNYGLIKTNYGIGVVYELIRDYDGNISKTVRYYLGKNIYKDEIMKQLKIYKQYYWMNYNIILKPITINILVKRISKNEIKLVFVDEYDEFKLNITKLFQ